MRVTVKICGLTSLGDARAAVAAGADFVGFVFDTTSRRAVGAAGPAWIRGVAGAPRVGVFRDHDEATVRRVRDEARLELVQLHGDETPEMCEALGGCTRVIKAIPVGRRLDPGRVAAYSAVARIVFDTASASGGGTGVAFDWRLLDAVPGDVAFWLAGGLTPENVARAVRETRAAGVDVASGVERSPGVKDAERVRRFISAVRSARRVERGGA
ncbi:MAG TPA: phosphoribosylanthranilate isomerase [Thermoanaerobaculaceae bacterium]|nr:phosphoribosylanthranilate isomerase [Thermoanaerobaculaceae bacterium]